MVTQIINIYGGIGAGKTTFAHELMSRMNKHPELYKVQFVPEFARELILLDEKDKLKDQVFVTTEQINRINKYIGKVDFIITDSPLDLGIVFSQDLEEEWEIMGLINDNNIDTAESSENINIFLVRDETQKFNSFGRVHDKKDVKEIDERLERFRHYLDIKLQIQNNEIDKVIKLLEEIKQNGK